MSKRRDESKVFTIPAGAPFLHLLAKGLIARAGGSDPLELARALVLVPTRRAARALSQAMLGQSPREALLLPSIRPIGDIDDEEIMLTGDEGFSLPPVIAPLERQLLLAKLIRARDSSLAPAQAAKLAMSLARFLDECQTAGIDPRSVKDIVPDEFALHWQKTVAFLEIVTVHWPRALEERGVSEPAQRRDAGLRLLAERWRKAPPQFPVIAAGSTASIPASAELIALIATLPKGAVVLPGLDQTLDEEAWELAGPEHAQYGMKQLLGRMKIARDEVALWPEAKDFAGSGRMRLLSETLRPAPATQAWRANIEDIAHEAAEGIAVLEADNPREEAFAIAIAMRETIEDEKKSAMLVCADRMLARRVASELRRFGIAVDDTGGVPLSKTAPGAFLSLVVEAAADGLTPVKLLASLKHPLASGGVERARFRSRVREFEYRHLRGLRPPPGLNGLESKAAGDEDAQKLAASLRAIFAPLCALETGTHSVSALARAHIASAQSLAMDEGGDYSALWRGEAGEAACDFLRELVETQDGEGMTLGDYAALAATLLSARVVRPRRNAHPRLQIFGPLEARLQQADLVIAGGLNEGSFPPAVDADPWASRTMRAQIGLEQPERRVGLSAHDFQMLAANPRVLLTRAKKADGAPVAPSRFLVRLMTLIEGAGIKTEDGGHYLQWSRELDKGMAAPRELLPPAPKPPVAVRPRMLSATSIEKWVRDPYAIYARHILKLRPLDPLDAEPDARERGKLFHAILEDFSRSYPSEMPGNALEAITAMARERFAPLAGRPGVMAFWWPRFLRAAEWFLGEERIRRKEIAQIHAEIAGEIRLNDFLLKARADRIDVLTSGEIEILDFKTGTVPSDAQIETGLSPQLPLEALIAGEGGFAALGKRPVRNLFHVKLSGGKSAGAFIAYKKNIAETVNKARAGLIGRIAAFDLEQTPYFSRIHVKLTTEEGDYDHLARVAEWSGRVESE